MKMVERTIGTQAGTGGSRRCRRTCEHTQSAALPRPLGDPHGAVTWILRRSRRPERAPPWTTRGSASPSACCSPGTRTRPGPTRLRGAPASLARRRRDVDDKWALAFEQARTACARYARLLGDAPARSRSAQNTHDLVVRLLSALPLKRRPRLVTTDGEFHTIRRQLDRLAKKGRDRKRRGRRSKHSRERLARAVDDGPRRCWSRRCSSRRGASSGLADVAAACRTARRGAAGSTPTTSSTSCRSLAAEDCATRT